MKEFIIFHKYKILTGSLILAMATGTAVYFNSDDVDNTSSDREYTQVAADSIFNDYEEYKNTDTNKIKKDEVDSEDSSELSLDYYDYSSYNNDNENDNSDNTDTEDLDTSTSNSNSNDSTLENEYSEQTISVTASSSNNSSTNLNSKSNNSKTSNTSKTNNTSNNKTTNTGTENNINNNTNNNTNNNSNSSSNSNNKDDNNPGDNTNDKNDIETPDVTEPEEDFQDIDNNLPSVELPNYLKANDIDATYQVKDDINIESSATINGNYDITYNSQNLPSFLSLDKETGNITGNAEYEEDGVYNIVINATGRGETISYNVNLTIEESDVEKAMNGEDLGILSREDIVDYNNYLESKDYAICEKITDEIYGEDDYYEADFSGSTNLYWKGTLNSVNDNNYSVMGNEAGNDWMYYGDWIGTRYIVSGVLLGDAVSGDYIFEDSDFAANLFRFLSEDEDFFMSEAKIFTSDYQAGQLKTYLTKRGIEYNVTFTRTLDESVDFIWPQVTTNDTVDFAIEHELPIIAQYNYHWRSDISYKRFGVTLNYAYQDNNTFNDTEDPAEPCKNDFTAFSRIIDTLENDELAFINYDEACSVYATKRTCDMNVLQTSDGDSYNHLLGREISRLRNALNNLDIENTSVFDITDRRIKLAVLYADSLRSEVEFNYTYKQTPDNVFYGSYFADSIISYSREVNYPQEDLGTFLTNYDEVQALDTVSNEEFSYTPTLLADNYSAGYYLQPGETLTLKRTDDNSAVTTKVFLNMQRNGSARVWDSHIRPEYLQTTSIVIEPGEEITLSSPHGGLMYIYTPSGNESEVSFEISNVVKTTVLRTEDEDDINEFIKYVNTTPLEYVDMETTYFSIHSWVTGMKQGFKNYNGDGAAYINDINTYGVLGNYGFAGFESEAIGDLSENVSSWFLNLGLTDYNDSSINSLPRKQHFNVDNKVLCGNFCSGNPIDYQGTFNPLSTHTSHEMGHNLSRSHLQLYNGRSTEVLVEVFANNTLRQLKLDNGAHHYNSVVSTQDETLWYDLNEYYNNDGEISVNAPYWTKNTYQADQKYRVAMYLQIQYASENEELYTILNILDRLACYYDNNSATWEANKDALGFSNYTQAEFQAISPNDFILISASYVGQKDMIEFFNGLTIETSDKAKEQVRSMNYDEVMEAGMYFINYYDYKQRPIYSENWFMPFGEDKDYWPTEESGYWDTVANQYEYTTSRNASSSLLDKLIAKTLENDKEIIVASEETEDNLEN